MSEQQRTLAEIATTFNAEFQRRVNDAGLEILLNVVPEGCLIDALRSALELGQRQADDGLRAQNDALGALSSRLRSDLQTAQGKIPALVKEVAHLTALIGYLPKGAHPDDWRPRAATWHQERANWAAEAERQREYIKVLEQQLKAAEAANRLYLDQPADRLWHAADGTWWRREGDTLQAADPPPEVARLRAEAESLRHTNTCLRSELSGRWEQFRAEQAEAARLRKLNEALAERCAGQSETLARAAQRSATLEGRVTADLDRLDALCQRAADANDIRAATDALAHKHALHQLLLDVRRQEHQTGAKL